MKMMVKLIVLLATLLLLTGVAFAADCGEYCYEVTATEVDNPEHTHTACVKLQFCDDNTGKIGSPIGLGNMSLFFDPMRNQALGYGEIDGGCVGYFKFHGDWLYIITGIGYCDGDRWQLRGHKTDELCCPPD